ncbi:hypothetical protein BY996DRAFT_4584919, partial [Phakopsora pachyrhizi]
LTFHILLQLISWGILIPIGSILGINRSSLHPPLQLITTLLISLPAISLPHLFPSESYSSNAHSKLSTPLTLSLIGQLLTGIFLKTHTLERTTLRLGVRVVHGVFGRCFPILSWTQFILGGIAALGFCFGSRTGQCLAHFIMGSAFIGYGLTLMLMIQYGQSWLRRHKTSQDHLDCWVITVWGVVNTFTEHGVFFSAGWKWSHKDMQHTALGAFWALTGLLGIYQSRNARRSIVPGLIVMISGWVFQSHQQSIPFSTKVHGSFGVTLMAAGLIKIIEVCWDGSESSLSTKRQRRSNGIREMNAFDHITPLLLVIAGTMFMSSTEEQILLILKINMDHSTYLLCQVSVGSMIYLYFNLMSSLYRSTRPLDDQDREVDQNLSYSKQQKEEENDDDDDEEEEEGKKFEIRPGAGYQPIGSNLINS